MKWIFKNNKSIQNFSDLYDILLSRVSKDKDFFSKKNVLDLNIEDTNISKEQALKAFSILKNSKNILIVGDYDVDGVVSSSILYEFLKKIKKQVTVVLPDREKDGYGISVKLLKKAFNKQSFDTVISVDNGILAFDVAEFLDSQNINFLIFDHHKKSSKGYPKAKVILHDESICASAVCWFFVKTFDHDLAKEQVDILTIATVADVMPLIGVNRVIVKTGLSFLMETKRVGLNALFFVSSVDKSRIDVYTIGFILGPRINALGRLDHNIDSFYLLTTDDKNKAFFIANKLNIFNSKRQNLTKQMFEKSLKNINETDEFLISKGEYHKGIVGLLSSKLTTMFGKPSLVLSIDKNTQFFHGSGRSIKNFDITGFLSSFSKHYESFGGHKMACGITVKKSKWEQLEPELIKTANTLLKGKTGRFLEIDGVVKKDIINLKFFEVLQKFAPFGHGNLEPVFVISTKIKNVFTFGKENKFLRFYFSNFTPQGFVWDKNSIDILDFDKNKFYDIAFVVKKDSYMYDKTVLYIKDIRLSSLQD